MTKQQVERLKRDSKELKHYMFKLEKQGKSLLARKMKKKMEYLNSCIYDFYSPN